MRNVISYTPIVDLCQKFRVLFCFVENIFVSPSHNLVAHDRCRPRGGWKVVRHRDRAKSLRAGPRGLHADALTITSPPVTSRVTRAQTRDVEIKVRCQLASESLSGNLHYYGVKTKAHNYLYHLCRQLSYLQGKRTATKASTARNNDVWPSTSHYKE